MNKFIKIYIQIILAVLLVPVFTSCEKEIDVDLRSIPPRIQIEGIVKQNQLATVRISQTVDFDDNSGYPFLKGAIVTISDDTGNSEVLTQDATGWYMSENIKGEEGRTYHMSVVYDGKEYTSTSKMPPHVELDSLSMYKMPVMDYAFPMIHFKDPKGTTNQYYRALLFINGKQHPDVNEFVLSAEFMDGDVFHQFLPVFINDDDVDPIKQGDELTIEFQCLDKGAYTFFYTLSRIEEAQVNPTSNISNGALGYFSACTAQQKSIIAEWEE
ncbi:DUF4249 domain-containing protein [Dysgonomonas sp. BGC7]|uniref:DUF4249 domain-containing protein n=1 Tax=Dysgonomonas sp. BGC7 TaxID=1658008 RepID=UPI000680C0FE|nr:DUF4249 domain-containing protein [Dysgonomonas sp. BGC7]MBD8388802.1 DUF4249 domain-containing protein [Dysgonomonas sp. BGC7]